MIINFVPNKTNQQLVFCHVENGEMFFAVDDDGIFTEESPFVKVGGTSNYNVISIKNGKKMHFPLNHKIELITEISINKTISSR